MNTMEVAPGEAPIMGSEAEDISTYSLGDCVGKRVIKETVDLRTATFSIGDCVGTGEGSPANTAQETLAFIDEIAA